KVKQLTTALADINSRLSKAPVGSSTRSNLESLRQNSQGQLNTQTGKLNELTTATISAGDIISDARLPEDPTSPDPALNTGAGASRGSATTLVAANVATARARTGSDVVLIGAHLPDSVVDAAPLARMLGVAAMPGLSDLLAGRIGLNRAMQRTPRIPSLRVIT